MDAFLSSFPISFLLRSMFAGVFFVVSYYLAIGKDLQQFIDSGNIFTGVLPVALFTGVVIYGLHRSLIFPILECLFNSPCARELRKIKNLPLIREITMKEIATRCDHKAKDIGQQCCERAKYMEAWADYIHLQYTSSLCIIAGYFTGIVVSHDNCIEHRRIGWFILAALVLFIAAVISNWRSYSVDECWAHFPYTRTKPQN